MKKNICLLLICFSFAFAPLIADAKSYQKNDIPKRSYVIGGYLYTSPNNSILDTSQNSAATYDGSGLTTPDIMLASTTFTDSVKNNMIIYYRGFTGSWSNAVTNTSVTPSDTFDITHVNGVCIDPICKGETYTITYVYNDTNTDNKVVNALYNEVLVEPVKPTKLGHEFQCWLDTETNECYDFSTKVTKNLTLEASWETLTYKVTYHNPFKLASEKDEVVECNFSATENCSFIDLNESTNGLYQLKEGYIFKGWSKAEFGEKIYDKDSDFEELFGSVTEFTLYPIFNTNEYTISYNLAGGTFTTPQKPVTVYDPSNLEYTIAEPVRTGYTFNGWSVTGNATIEGNVLNITKVSDITLTANWEKTTYNVVYNNTKLNSEVCNYDEICLLDYSRIAVSGKEITKVVANLNNQDVEIGTQVKNLSSDGEDVEVIVTYGPVTYKITYDLAGGTLGVEAPETIQYNVATTISDPSKTGYTFKGWEVVDDYGSISEGKLTLTTEKDVKLVAQWEPIQYLVKYELPERQYIVLNITDEEGNYVYCKYDQDCTLKLSNLDQDGLVLKEVTADVDGVTYDVGDTVRNLTSKNEDVLVNIDYDYISYDIIYNYDGGSASAQNLYSYTIENKNTELVVPTKIGYTFNGWKLYYAINEDGNIIPGDVAENAIVSGNTLSFDGEKASLIVTANWSLNEFNLIYDLNGGSSNTVPNKELCSYGSCTLTSVVPTKDGYNFDGWLDESSGMVYMASEAGNNLYIDSTTDVTLVAKWSNKDSYDIKYALNGGTFNDCTLTNCEVNSSYLEGETPTLAEPTKFGYTFKGWSLEENGTSFIDEVPANRKSDITVYANWEAVKYNVYLYDEDGTSFGDSAVLECTYGNSCTLDYSNYSSTTDEIVGWSLDKDGGMFFGNGISSNYLCQFSYKVLDSNEIDYSCSFYAVKNDRFKITYDFDGGAFAESDDYVEYFYGHEEVEIPTPVKDGYVLAGWTITTGNANLDINYETGNYVLTLNKAGDVTLKAVWNVANKVTLDLNGGELAVGELSNPYELANGHTFVIPYVTKTGYLLTGWDVYNYVYKFSTDYTYYEVLTAAYGEEYTGKDSGGNDVEDEICDEIAGCTYYVEISNPIYDSSKTYAVAYDPSNKNKLELVIEDNFNDYFELSENLQTTGFTGKSFELLEDIKLVANWIEVDEYSVTYMFESQDITDSLVALGFPSTFEPGTETITIPGYVSIDDSYPDLNLWLNLIDGKQYYTRDGENITINVYDTNIVLYGNVNPPTSTG